MLSYTTRSTLLAANTCIQVSLKFINKAALNSKTKVCSDLQTDYFKSIISENKVKDWCTVKTNVLSKQGNINKKNINAVFLKMLVVDKRFDDALSFVNHLKSSNEELALGTINGILNLYNELGKERKLIDAEKKFILDTHRELYEKYKVLDYKTSDILIQALCVIDEWKKAYSVLNDLYLTGSPSPTNFSTLISTLLRNNEINEAMSLICKCLKDQCYLKDNVFEEWINYIFKKYEDKKIILKHLDEMNTLLSAHCTVVSTVTAKKINETYSSLGWNVHFTKILRSSGECVTCKQTLDCLNLNENEFRILQDNVKNKLLVGSDLFLKTSPGELKKFIDFINDTAPYDVVIDALNIAYAAGKVTNVKRLELLKYVVNYFLQTNKRILLLGRKHMLSWHKGSMIYLMRNTCNFFTENISEDDPYFITAAMLSGPKTDIVSKDLLRGHKFLLKDNDLKQLFQRWQWQHQWMVFINRRIVIQPPLVFTPCAQKKNGAWHIPYENDDVNVSNLFNHDIPDLHSWICMQPRSVNL